MIKSDIAFEPEHDHSKCVHSALKEAAQLCKQRQQRFTPIRKLVLELIWSSHKPLGAYDLLPALAEAGFNSAPPTVYRALEFLQEQGLVHRIASLNAFIGCTHPKEHKCHSSFLICTQCHSAVEVESDLISSAIEKCAATMQFQVASETVEIAGTCSHCLAGAEA